jgi:hypothetical protein
METEELPLYIRDATAPALTLQLLEAASNECPITLMPIAESPPLRGRLNEARLPCGHTFAAVPLLRHFVRNRMRCPVCRGGVDARLDAARSRVVLEDEPPASEDNNNEAEEAASTTIYAVRVLGGVRLYAVEGTDLPPADTMLLLLMAFAAQAAEEEEEEADAAH